MGKASMVSTWEGLEPRAKLHCVERTTDVGEPVLLHTCASHEITWNRVEENGTVARKEGSASWTCLGAQEGDRFVGRW